MRFSGEVFTVEAQQVDLIGIDGSAVIIKLQSGAQVVVERSSLELKNN